MHRTTSLVERTLFFLCCLSNKYFSSKLAKVLVGMPTLQLHITDHCDSWFLMILVLMVLCTGLE